jgi:hypothetical protein
MTAAAGIEGARRAVAEARAHHHAAAEALDRATTALKCAVHAPIQAADRASSGASAPDCDHRRAHRPGRPARIDTDPELDAFIRARIDRLTCTGLAEELAAAFPPARRVGKRAIHAWWHRRGKAGSGGA